MVKCLELSLVGWCIQGGYSSLGTQPASPLVISWVGEEKKG